MYPIFGASLLAASASLPLHLLPFLIVVVTQEDRLPLAWVGWLGSAYMLGQLIAALVLPSFGVDRIPRFHAAMGVLGLLLVLGLSSALFGAPLLTAWFAVGLVCGMLHFLATTTAAAASDRRKAFSLRMAMSSLVAGVVIAALQWAKGVDAYSTLAIQLAVAYGVLACIGLVLYRAPTQSPAVAPSVASSPSVSSPNPARLALGPLAGLGVLFLLFVGQYGLWAFVMQGARGRGVPMDDMTYAIAVCKLAAGAVVLAGAFYPRAVQSSPASSLLGGGMSVAAGVAGVAMASNAAVFWLGLFFWETGLSVISARLQALAAQDNPRVAGMWMTGAVFMGAATGPALGGLVVHAGYFGAYAVFAVVTALIPVAWFRMRAVKSLV